MILGSGLGIVLSLVFGCLLLALIAELYYLLWWRSLVSRTNPPSAGAGDSDPPDTEAGPTKDAGVEAELLRLQNRLLFTIKEETKEEVESEEGKSILESYSRQGLNPLFESSSSSPPPTFKFMRDAEEKLQRRLLEAEEERELRSGSFIRVVVAKSTASSQVNPLPPPPS